MSSSCLGITSLGRGVRSGLLQQTVEFSEPVATPVDEDDVDVVQQSVEDCGGQDLIIGEDVGPVPDVLVRGQDDGALLVACADESEEEIRLLAVERPEADLVNDQQ